MLEHLIEEFLPEIISIIEIIGILIIFSGSIKAFVDYIMSYLNKKHYPVRLRLGFSLALGLEFKMGAEILKTVLVRDLSEIWILAAIIVLRTLLSLVIHYEMKNEEAHEAIQDALHNAAYNAVEKAMSQMDAEAALKDEE